MKNLGSAIAFGMVWLLAVNPSQGGDPTKSGEIKVREIKGIEAPKEVYDGSVRKPIVIDSAAKLEKAFTSKEAKEKLQKEVNLEKETLLVFGWSGSGGDRIAPSTVKDAVQFAYTAGLTDDLRRHAHLYVIPRGAKWSVSE